MINVATSLQDQGFFIGIVAVTPTPTVQEVLTGGGWSNTYVGFFRFNPPGGQAAMRTGVFEMEYSPAKYGSVTPTRVKVMDQGGVMRSLGPSGVLDFVPGHAIQLLAGMNSSEFPVDIYFNGGRLYLMTVVATLHNSNFPCDPTTSTYDANKGFAGSTLRVRRLFVNPLGLGSSFREVQSSFRTVTGVVPTDYVTGFAGGARVDHGGVQYLITSQRDATICTHNFFGVGDAFVDTRITVSKVTEPVF